MLQNIVRINVACLVVIDRFVVSKGNESPQSSATYSWESAATLTFIDECRILCVLEVCRKDGELYPAEFLDVHFRPDRASPSRASLTRTSSSRATSSKEC